ncbi:MAG TPA: DMT family transporter, partial [Gemmatimonadales bacterium]|nr:DMT family transporter [Gemmatimonadales bacterium]
MSAPVQAPSSVPARTPVLADLGMLAVVLIWGLNFSVTKGAFDTFPPLAFTAVRFAIASVVLMLLVRRVEGAGRLPDGALVRLVVLGVVGNTLYQIAFISGLARTSASNSALILAAMPP